MRLVALDERGLGEQRLRLVLHRHELEVVHQLHHRAHLRRQARVRAEVRLHPPAQVLGLADVDDFAPAISHEIAAGAAGKRL